MTVNRLRCGEGAEHFGHRTRGRGSAYTRRWLSGRAAASDQTITRFRQGAPRVSPRGGSEDRREFDIVWFIVTPGAAAAQVGSGE